MVGLIEDYREHAERQRAQDGFKVLGGAVSDALEPFRPGRVTFHIFDKLYDTPRIEVVFENFPSLSFSKVIDRGLLYTIDTSYISNNLAKSIYDHLINRPRVEPESNVILGDS